MFREGSTISVGAVQKNKERHFACFFGIFKKLEITIPFGEALQQMPLYSKFLKDLLTKKGKYIHNDNIVVEGNCSVVIQRILPPIQGSRECHNPLLYWCSVSWKSSH